MGAKMFRAYRDLKDDLGKIDASFAFIALSLVYFESHAITKDDPVNFYREVAAQHNIRVNLKDTSDPHKKVFLSAVVSIHAEFDRFLKGLMEELESFDYDKIDVSTKRDGESRLAFLIRATKGIAPDIESKLSPHLVELCEYLRLVRNYHAHGLASPQKDCTRLHKKISETCGEWPGELKNLQWSSKCCDLRFDDVIILTIAAKLLAEEVSAFFAPEPAKLLDHPLTKEFARHEGARLTQASLELFFHDRFGLDRDNAESLAGRFLNQQH